jgi:hypothetical protein
MEKALEIKQSKPKIHGSFFIGVWKAARGIRSPRIGFPSGDRDAYEAIDGSPDSDRNEKKKKLPTSQAQCWASCSSVKKRARERANHHSNNHVKVHYSRTQPKRGHCMQNLSIQLQSENLERFFAALLTWT